MNGEVALVPSRPQYPPGPIGGAILGVLPELRRDPLGLFLRSADQFGGISSFRAAYKRVYLVSEPALIKEVLVDRMRQYRKGISYESLHHLMGNGLLVSEGDLWRRQRRLAQPMFHKKALFDKLPVMVSCVERMFDRWDGYASRGESFDLVPEMMRLAFDVVGETLMGAHISEQMDLIEEVLGDATDWVYRRMQAAVPLPPSFPTPGNLRFRRAMRRLEGVVQRTIDAHRQGMDVRGLGPDTMLARLMAAHEGDGPDVERMSDRQLRDEVLTFLLAGHETTGSALVWTWYLLGQHSEEAARMYDEVDRVVAANGTPSAEVLMQLTWTRQIIDESMRLYPPAWSFTRAPIEDEELGGYRLPAGSIVVISPFVNHRLSRFWPDPDRFDPSRFEADISKSEGPYRYFPFGGGPHTCIGKYLTLIEVLLAMAMLARRYRVSLADRSPVRMDPSISLRPLDPLMVRIGRRGGVV